MNLLLDTGRDTLLNAIEAYGKQLSARKAVGLFYFAGHGAQLAWRNYLLPVDAVIKSMNDVPARAVELNTLLQGLTKAKNPMNVIVLDACRDNPFGTAMPVEQKGLSQFDAPPGSLLAYATSPGNVASDGSGANGLYTEHLLRELKTRGDQTAILSNGSPHMLASIVEAAGVKEHLDAVLSVDTLRIFKPRPEVYALVTDRFAVKPADVTFVSSNRWDVMGAAAFGFRCVWVNRSGMPNEYPAFNPIAVAPNLSGLVSLP